MTEFKPLIPPQSVANDNDIPALISISRGGEAPWTAARGHVAHLVLHYEELAGRELDDLLDGGIFPPSCYDVRHSAFEPLLENEAFKHFDFPATLRNIHDMMVLGPIRAITSDRLEYLCQQIAIVDGHRPASPAERHNAIEKAVKRGMAYWEKDADDEELEAGPPSIEEMDQFLTDTSRWPDDLILDLSIDGMIDEIKGARPSIDEVMEKNWLKVAAFQGADSEECLEEAKNVPFIPAAFRQAARQVLSNAMNDALAVIKCLGCYGAAHRAAAQRLTWEAHCYPAPFIPDRDYAREFGAGGGLTPA